MRALFLLALVSLTAQADDHRGRFERFCSRTDQGRTNRGFLCDSLAFFEAFPASGAGTSGACSTTPPTGAKGEVLTFTRASNGTCTKTATGGLATTGIADGDLVVLSSNQPRVEYDSAGTLGLLVEASRTNVNLQSANLADAVYSNVGTPTVTANTTVSPDGTTTMATIQDTSGAALEGRSQTVTVTAGQPYTLSVFVKAGTLAAVTVSLDGTTATCTSLSATTSTRCIVTDASASGAAIVASVTAGTVVSDTGSFKAWGQQVEQGLYATSYIPTFAGMGTRGVEDPHFAFSGGVSSGSMAVTQWRTGVPSADCGPIGVSDNVGSFRTMITNFGQPTNNFALYVNGASAAVATTGSLGSSRLYAYWGAAGTGISAGSLATGGAATESAAINRVIVGQYMTGGTRIADGIYSRVCVDPEPTRCR